MNNLEFNNDDKNELDKLDKITFSVLEIYKKLYELEICDMKDSEEYDKCLGYLITMKNIENDYYKKSKFTYNKICKWYYYIDKNIDIKDNYLEVLSSLDYKNIVICRIKERLKNILNIMNLGYYDISFNFINSLSKNNISFDNIFKCLKGCNNLDKYILNEVDSNYLSYLQDVIDNDNYSHLNNKLIYSKYMLSFVKEDLENTLLNNKFDIVGDNYIGSFMYLDLYNIYEKNDINIINILSIYYATGLIYDLSIIKDSDYYSDINFETSSLIYQMFIKSLLLFVDSNSINSTKENLLKLFNNDEYNSKYSDNRISRQLVINCINDSVIDKNKKYILRLKKENE